jgi:hypothetical protein
MPFCLQTKVALREPKKIRMMEWFVWFVTCQTCVRCLRIVRNAPSNFLQLYGLRPFAPYIFAGSLNALAWTITPILIVVVLFLATARVIHAIRDAPERAGTVEFTLSTLPTL